MTRKQHLKKLVRSRMAETGESYAQARKGMLSITPPEHLDEAPINIFHTHGYLPCTGRFSFKSSFSQSFIPSKTPDTFSPPSEARCLQAFYNMNDPDVGDPVGWDGDVLYYESDKLPDRYRKVKVTYRPRDDWNYEFYKITPDRGDNAYFSINKSDSTSPVLFDSETTPIIPNAFGSLLEIGEAILQWIDKKEKRRATSVSLVDNFSDIVAIGGTDITHEVYGGDEVGNLCVSAMFFQGGWFVWEYNDSMGATIVSCYAHIRSSAVTPEEVAADYLLVNPTEVDPVNYTSPLQLLETLQNCLATFGRFLTPGELSRLHDIILIQHQLWGLKRIGHFLYLAGKGTPGYVVTALCHPPNRLEVGSYPRELLHKVGWECEDWKALIHVLKEYHDNYPKAFSPCRCVANLINYTDRDWDDFYTVLELVRKIDLIQIIVEGGSYFVPGK